MNGKITATLPGVFINDCHCYSSSPGVQVDTNSLECALDYQWRDISQLIIEKGESISIAIYVFLNFLIVCHFCVTCDLKHHEWLLMTRTLLQLHLIRPD